MVGCPPGTVLGPLLFSLYINDISSDIESEIRLFADDCVCYHEIKDEEDTIIKSEMRSFKSNENIHKKEGGSYYVVSANKASSVTL